jgi:hypothetical protein
MQSIDFFIGIKAENSHEYFGKFEKSSFEVQRPVLKPFLRG